MRQFILTFVCLSLCPAALARWPQFRGPVGRGIPTVEKRLPTEIGPDKNVLWKVAVPAGHASPVIAGDKIFLAAVREEKLLTIALKRTTGKVLWERKQPTRSSKKFIALAVMPNRPPPPMASTSSVSSAAAGYGVTKRLRKSCGRAVGRSIMILGPAVPRSSSATRLSSAKITIRIRS